MDNKYSNISKELFPTEMLEKFKNVDFSIIQPSYSNLITHIELPEVPDFEPIPLREHIEKTEQYQADSLKILESINQNTANLYTLVDLINKNNEQQDELISLISEIMAISKAKNKKEADSLFRKVMDKTNTIIKDGETLYKIVGYATTVYSAVNTMFPNI